MPAISVCHRLALLAEYARRSAVRAPAPSVGGERSHTKRTKSSPIGLFWYFEMFSRPKNNALEWRAGAANLRDSPDIIRPPDREDFAFIGSATPHGFSRGSACSMTETASSVAARDEHDPARRRHAAGQVARPLHAPGKQRRASPA